MTDSNKVFAMSIFVMGVVVFLTTAGSVSFLYHTAVEEQKERLLEVVKKQARFIEAFHETTCEHKKDWDFEPGQSHAHELEIFFSKLSGSHRTGRKKGKNSPVLNFYIAEKKDNFVHFYVGIEKLIHTPVPYQKIQGKPMGHALEGKTDVLKTVDHMGNLILCSYTYAPSVRMGIVAKIFLNDLRLPFLKTALLTYLGAFVLFFLGGLAIKMTAAPLVSELEKKRRELEITNKNLHKLATTDNLTQLYNRQHFNKQMAYGILLKERQNCYLALILLDIDYFKHINDVLGHLTGDVVLKTLSELLSCQIRKSDILARWGGEEFAILLFDSDQKNARYLAEKLCTMIGEYDFGIGKKVTCSFGVTVHRKGETDIDFIKRADDALYAAKRSGRNQVVAR